MTDKITDIDQIKNEIYSINNKISGMGLHDILTKGEGWSVGHSIKDFGTKNSQLLKMARSVEAEYILKGLTVENQMILDPFMEVGTFGIAALKLGRKFVGIEIDPESYKLAQMNISNVLP